MRKFNRLTMTLALLIMAVGGAWAQSTYTVTFAANSNTKTVENVTLPKTFQCSYGYGDGELDLILKELYGWTGDNTFCDGETPLNSSDENKVVAGNDNGDHYITINNVFEGTVTITGYYVVNSVVIETPYSLEISIAAAAAAEPTEWDLTSQDGKVWTLASMPGFDVELEVEYYDAMIGETGYTTVKDAMDAAQSGDIITVFDDVDEPGTECGGGGYTNAFTLDLNGHSVTLASIASSSLTVKNGTLNCIINNTNTGLGQTLTLDNAKVYCNGIYDSEYQTWTKGLQWLAKNINVTNGSMLYIYGDTYFGDGGEDGFNLTIDNTSSVVLRDVILGGYNNTRVWSQFAQYMPSGYSINTDSGDEITNGMLMFNGNVYHGEVTLRPGTITLSDDVDNTALLASLNGEMKDIYLDRELVPEKWYTLCLPFAVDLTENGPLKGVTAKTLSKVENDGTTVTLTFGEAVESLAAGTPYIVRLPEGATENLVKPLFVEATISKTLNDVAVTGGTFKGTYVRVDWNAPNTKVLFLQNNEFLYPDPSAYVNAFRAYIELEDDVPVSAGAKIILDFGDDNASGIETVETDAQQDGIWYTLQGIPLDSKPTEKGIYILNGKKVAIK